jgi:Nucleotidyl transferase AbiEii toxin, Type IV TA system
MIPKDQIKNWRQKANWLFDRQVEQDLVISRALIELYNHPEVSSSLAFRGGTALNKLFFNPATRYNEDLDFVQIQDEPIGTTLSHIRSVLDPWLGEAKWSQKQRLVRLVYRFNSEDILFLSDIPMLLAEGTNWDEKDAWNSIMNQLIQRL